MSTEISASSASDDAVFDVHYMNWQSNIVITDASNGKQLYVLDSSKSSDRLVVTNAAAEIVGYSKTHSTTSRAEFEVITSAGLSNTFEMRDDKKIFGSPSFTSSTFDGQVMTWKNKSWSMSTKITYTLIDGKGLALAKFESSPKTKVGKLELVSNITKKDEINEIALMILTLLYRKLHAAETAAFVAVTS